MKNYNTRAHICGLLFFIGFLLIVGAVGQVEFYYMEVGEFLTRTVLGGLLMMAAMVVGGWEDIQDAIEERKGRK